MLFYLSLTLLILLILVILQIKLSRNNHWKKRNILQISDLIWAFMTSNNSLSEFCKTVYDKYKDEHIGTFMGTSPTLIVKNLEDIQAVFAGDFQSFNSRGIHLNENDLLGDSILFINDFRRWKLIRQKLTPVFTSAKLKNMFYIIEKCARDFVDFVEDNPHLRSKSYDVLSTYTTASIGASIFGIDIQTSTTMDSPFLDMARKSVSPTFKNNLIFSIANIFPKLFQFLKIKIFGEHEDFFIGVVKDVLDKRRNDTKKRYDFIEICLEIQKQGLMQDFATGYLLNPTDELLAAQAFFFFIAGAETTANSIHFTLLELASNQKILTKLHSEIDSIFNSNTEELTYGDIEKLNYLDMVVNEAMRKYPVLGILQRLCTRDTVLPTGGVKVNKDTVMVIPVYAIHRDERYYPNPEIFDPERFSPENVSKIPKYAYLPFGEGNRVCIGTRLARLQMKAGLAWLLRRFSLAEQKYKPERFERTMFFIRDAQANYELITRDVR